MKGNLVTRLLIVISCIAFSSGQSVNSFNPEEQDKLEAVYKTRSNLEARSYPQNNSINQMEEAIEVKRGRAVNGGGSSDLLRKNPKAHSDAYSSLIRPSSSLGARISHFAGLLALLLF